MRFTFLLIIIVSSGLYAQFTNVPIGSNKPGSISDSDSLYAGLGFVARSPNLPIEVHWKKDRHLANVALYFMVPGIRDSALFLFHNDTSSYPGEARVVNIGSYPTGTPIVLMCMVAETCGVRCEDFLGHKFYTGQNRDGIDLYASELVSPKYAKKWAAVGQKDSATVEVGFDFNRHYNFASIMFEVTNCRIVK